MDEHPRNAEGNTVYHKHGESSDMNSPRHNCSSGQTLSQTTSVSVTMSCALALIWTLEKIPKSSDPATTTIACRTWSCKQNISASSVATSDKYILSLKKYSMPVKTASSGYLWWELKNLGIRYCTWRSPNNHTALDSATKIKSGYIS